MQRVAQGVLHAVFGLRYGREPRIESAVVCQIALFEVLTDLITDGVVIPAELRLVIDRREELARALPVIPERAAFDERAFFDHTRDRLTATAPLVALLLEADERCITRVQVVEMVGLKLCRQRLGDELAEP